MRSGTIIHHPTTAPGALLAWNDFLTILNEKRPGYLLWALNGSYAELLEHIRAQPEGGLYRIVPFLIAPGKHFQEDISKVEETLRAERPDLRFERTSVLLENAKFLEFWLSEL